MDSRKGKVLSGPHHKSEEDSSLQWGPETMKPSKGLQNRLKGLQQPISQLIDARPDESPPEPVDIPDLGTDLNNSIW